MPEITNTVSLPGPLFIPLATESHRYKALFGGRGSGKSQTVCDILLVAVYEKGIKVCCFREYQNSITDSVYSLMVSEIHRLEIPGFTILGTELRNASGGVIRFKGIARNLAGIKSMDNFDVFWVEEAQTMSKDSLRMLKPTLRKPGSELWFTFNPLSRVDPISEEFILPFENDLAIGPVNTKDFYVAKVNYPDNKFFPEVLEGERARDKDRLARAMYRHIWDGEFYDEVEESIIKVEWFEAAIDAHEKLGFEPRGLSILSHDPADTGGDTKGRVLRRGSVFIDADIKETQDVNVGCDWALEHAINNQADAFNWDGDGIGAGLQRQVSESLGPKKIDYHMFKGSESPERPTETYLDPDSTFDLNPKQVKTNRQMFLNKRAQYYWYLRDGIYNAYLAVEKGRYISPDKILSVSSKIERLNQFQTEVCKIPRVHNRNGMIQIMSKVDMKRLKIPSPGMADSAMMTLDIPIKEAKFEPFEFDV
jgi:phage terminase large subunit